MVSGLGVARAVVRLGRPGLLAPGRSEVYMPPCNTRMGLACEEAKKQAGAVRAGTRCQSVLGRMLPVAEARG